MALAGKVPILTHDVYPVWGTPISDKGKLFVGRHTIHIMHVWRSVGAWTYEARTMWALKRQFIALKVHGLIDDTARVSFSIRFQEERR